MKKSEVKTKEMQISNFITSSGTSQLFIAVPGKCLYFLAAHVNITKQKLS